MPPNASDFSSNIYIDPDAVVLAGATIGPGAWIGPRVTISSGVTISPNAVVGLPTPRSTNAETLLDRNSWVGPGVHIEPGVQISQDVHIHGASIVREQVRVEQGARIGPRCTIMDHALIGSQANLFAEVYICEHARIGQHCQISPGATLLNDAYPPTGLSVLGPDISDCSILGAQCVIWPGVTIGYHAMIASFSEVKHDVEDFVMVRGQPAKPICDIRMVRAKIDGKWIYPYPWMRHQIPNEDLSRPVKGAHERNLDIMRSRHRR